MSALAQKLPTGPAPMDARPVAERIPRQVLTRRLERLLVLVDSTPERVVECPRSLPRCIDVRGPVRVRVDAIWVFGSYARGAPALALTVRSSSLGMRVSAFVDSISGAHSCREKAVCRLVSHLRVA